MKFPCTYKVHSEEETVNIAQQFSSTLSPGEVIILNGNLGSGKTFFIKNVLQYFNITEVNSPTFSLVNEYSSNRKFYHFDFYRIENVNELYDIGFDEYMADEEAVKFIEWGNLFRSILPHRRTEIEIILNHDMSRKISFNKQ
jgi:tRNA threonylcarbamoyladenosine biosynthesis protein TsaE